MDFNRIIKGMIRAIRLDKAFYNEVEQDTSYNRDALAVVVIAALATGLGGLVRELLQLRILAAVLGFIVAAALIIAVFFIWVFIAHFVGTKFFKGQGDRGEVQRALGFAFAPQILNLLAFIPCLGGLIGLAAWVLTIVTGFIAVRESLDQDNTNAALTIIVSGVIGFIVQAAILAVFAALGLGAAAITGAFNQ